MTVIAQDVFTIAMNLMDEQSQDGTFAGYPDEYKKKAWPILTLLQAELSGINTTIIAVTDPSNVLQLDDRSCLTALPYGLAAHLIMPEDEAKASFFNARYDELKISRSFTTETIKDVYWEGSEESTDQTPNIDGGSFLDPNSGTYDGGEW